MDSVLLVGGGGFLGLHLIEEFWNVEPRPQIHVFDIRPLPSTLPKGFTFDVAQITSHVGDLTKHEDVDRVLKSARPSVVVHSASPVHGLGPAVYRKVNVDGTQTLADACTQNRRVKALVYTSSAGVVFNGEDLFGVNESTPFPAEAMDAYNVTKEQGETIALKANSPLLKTVALRPAGIFGPGDRQMIPNLREVAKTGKNKFQLGDNNNLFDVTYVGNVAYAHVLAAQALLRGTQGVGGEPFFITNDEPIFFWSFARAIWAADGKRDQPKFTLSRSMSLVLGYLSQWGCALVGKEPSFTAFRVKTACATRYYDITKAKTVLNYEPKWTLQEAIAKTAAAFE